MENLDHDSRAEPAPSLDEVLEALLLAADGPLSLDALQRLLTPEHEPTRDELRAQLAALSGRLAEGACELVEVSSGWRIQIRSRCAAFVARMWQDKPPRYSRALLETLALIVYRQPITRGEIEEVRGVAVSTQILRTLQDRGWIRELGQRETPGRPTLYGSTRKFLDDFNLRSLEQLPNLPEVKDLEQLEARLREMGFAIEPAAAAPDPEEAEESAEAVDESPPRHGEATPQPGADASRLH
jgi:segregation and condensation protein B